jgi:hypothetical protein
MTYPDRERALYEAAHAVTAPATNGIVSGSEPARPRKGKEG